MRVTITQIADSLSLSPATVSRVLNQTRADMISAATRQRVMDAAKELGYAPNRAAVALATGRTHLIALWLPHLHEPFYTSVTRYSQAQIVGHKREMVVREPRTADVPAASASAQDHWPVDGILACDYLGSAKAFKSEAGTAPAVGMGAYYVESSHFVGVDLYAGAVEAVQHLVLSGCRRIAYMAPEWSLVVGDARYDAFLQTLEQSGFRHEVIPTSDYSRPTSRQAIRDYVTAHGRPDGLFCRNDDMAIGAYRGLRDLGVRIPEDISLIGCDGIEDTEYLDTPITTIVVPVEEMCATAWEFLERCMDAPDAPLQQKLLKPRLALRDSVRR